MKLTRRGSLDKAAKKFDIVTIGAATRDVFAMSSSFEKRANHEAPDGFDACLPMGAKIELDRMSFETGGGATNAAAAFSHFGMKTACVTRVGEDLGGHEIERQLQDFGIDTEYVQHDAKNPTAYSVILVAGKGHRAILTARGASKHIDTKAVAWDKISAEWLYITGVSGNHGLLKDAFKTAKLRLSKVAWNPGAADLALGIKTLSPYLLQTDILILNREEASELAQLSYRHVDALIRALAHLPRLALVITDGENGAYAAARGMVWHVTPPKVKAINTTGAGDAFGSGFTAAVMRQADIEAALQAGALNANGVVQHMGAKVGLLRAYPTERELKRAKVKALDI